MFFKKIVTEAHHHFSYVVGEGHQAFVIDPRCDIEIYLQTAAEGRLQIMGIFETHRNEDILSGARELGEKTGAPVYRSGYEPLLYTYGKEITEDDHFPLGVKLTLQPIHTPGHTKGHLSYLLLEDNQPYLLFSGDTLFYGSVGRTDFYGKEEIKTLAAALRASIFDKLLPLGDGVLLMPAHGAGSACGENLAEREISTLGYERMTNPALTASKTAFMKQYAQPQPLNPIFKTMEKLNLTGELPRFAMEVIAEPPQNALIVDVRDRWAFMGGHYPGSISVPVDVLPTFIGWFVDANAKIVLMAEALDAKKIELALRGFQRQGYGNVAGVIGKTLKEHVTSGGIVQNTRSVRPDQYLKLIQTKPDIVTLDVRQPDEIKKTDPLYKPLNIPLQQLPQRLEELPKGKKLYVVCNSGERASMAGAYLQMAKKISPIVVAGEVEESK